MMKENHNDRIGVALNDEKGKLQSQKRGLQWHKKANLLSPNF